MRKPIFSLLVLVFAAQVLWAVDANYYSSLNNKSGSELRSALTELLYNKHTLFSKYDWDFPYDYDNSGNMLDIYSNCGFNSNNEYSSTYKCCCDAINREHVICQSNFGGNDSKDKIPQYSDRHHLYPVDGRANGHRSDLPFGECSGGSHGSCSSASTVYPSEGKSTCSNHEYGKSGVSTFNVALPSGEGKVYEVGDEYKGDIARAVLYMVVRYAESTYCRLPDGAKYCTSSGGGNVSNNLKTANSYPVTAWANTTKDKVGQMFSSSLSTNFGLSNYGKAILLKWHRQDPVSQKEINRNAGVEAVQGNRNPFVDYPYLVEYLWGEHAGETVNLTNLVGSFESGFVPGVSDGSKSASLTPTISVSSTSVTMDQLAVNGTSSKTITISGSNLSGNISIDKSGSDYITINSNSVSPSEATDGKVITITYHPAAKGNHSATLTLTSTGATSKVVTISGSCVTYYTAVWMDKGASFDQTSAVEGSSPNTPDDIPDDCDENRVFLGWTAQADYNDYSNAPNDLFTTSAPAISTDMTFYAVYADKVTVPETTITKNYTFNITKDDFNTTSYAANNNEKMSIATAEDNSKMNVYWTSNQVYQTTSIMQWQKSNGYIYNSTDLGTITAVTITSTDGSFTTYYGTSEQPSSSTTVGNGFFKIVVGDATGKTSNIAISFQRSQTTPSYTYYSNYNTLCPNCSLDFAALAATNVAKNSFTANWKDTEASSYALDVTVDVPSSKQQATTFFEQNFIQSLGQWTINNKSGYESVWSHNSSYGAYATSYVNSERNAAESWLISPSIDLTNATKATLITNHVFRYANTVYVMISMDDGNNWTQLSPSDWTASDSWTFVDYEVDLGEYVGETVIVGLKYVGTTSACPTWEIKTLTISGIETVPVTLHQSISGYPKNVTGTSYSVTGLSEGTNYHYTVTPEGCSASNEINVTTTGTATDVENIESAPVARKVLIGDKLYVIFGDKLFDVMGRQVR